MFMPHQPPDVTVLRSQLRRGLAMTWLGLGMLGRAAVWLAWIGVTRTFGIGLALVVLFEQWGWRPLAAALGMIAQLAPIAALERLIQRLPPYAALVTFALPALLLVPLKLLALYLIANGHAVSATALFIGAKVLGTAIVARLYNLTEPQLMQIAWVRRGLEVVLPRLHALHAAIRQSWAWRYGRMIKARIKRALAPYIFALKMRMAGLLSPRRGQS